MKGTALGVLLVALAAVPLAAEDRPAAPAGRTRC